MGEGRNETIKVSGTPVCGFEKTGLISCKSVINKYDHLQPQWLQA